jgi:dihydrodipicolinate synthase/N-acetylneuraminate lyase
MARDYVLQGGDGVISVTANVAPKSVAKVPDCMLIAC